MLQRCWHVRIYIKNDASPAPTRPELALTLLMLSKKYMINNDEQFEKSQRRTGNPDYKGPDRDSDGNAEKDASHEQTENNKVNDEEEPSAFEEAMDATDSKNRLKDESMKERNIS
jgi:hypothetical protein